MASEPDIVELYIDPESRELLLYVPAADIVLNSGEEEIELPKTAVRLAQINIDHAVEYAKKRRPEMDF